jgi:hypothetical protein
MKKFNRRDILLLSAAAIASAPIVALTSRVANAAETPQVDPSGPQAKALSYIHKSAKADQNCLNCRLYTGAADSTWGPCAIFPGKQVAGAGWCSAWIKKA